MFNQYTHDESDFAEVKNRKSYFIVSAIAMGSILFAALIVSLFAIDLNIGMDDIDMSELVAPIDVTDQKLPEPETAPHVNKGGGSTASRQVNMARLDESPREVPTAVSTTPNNAKERPSVGNFQVGKFDTELAAGSGSGRGDGTGSGDGDGTGLGDGPSVNTDEVASTPPPPPAKKIEPVKEKPIIRSMGIVNGYATSLPLPAVPAAARAVNANGNVQVQVLIDEHGNVISATAVSGNLLLRASSEAAAKIAKFAPAQLAGTAVKASGIINYHFAG